MYSCTYVCNHGCATLYDFKQSLLLKFQTSLQQTVCHIQRSFFEAVSVAYDVSRAVLKCTIGALVVWFVFVPASTMIDELILRVGIADLGLLLFTGIPLCGMLWLSISTLWRKYKFANRRRRR